MQTLISFFRRFFLLFILIFILGAGGYMALKEFWYFGSVRVFPSVYPITLQVDEQGEFVCKNSSCDFRFVPGKYRASAEKIGYEKIFFTIEIVRGKIFEKNLIFNKKQLQLQVLSEGEKNTKNFSRNLLSKKIFLPLGKNSISSKISDFSLQDEKIFWKKNFLFSPKTPTYISSDEVGRGVIFVSENLIKKFERKTQNLSTILKKNISAFEAYPHGMSMYQDTQGKFFVLSEKNLSIEVKDIFPFSFKTLCMPSKNIILYLQSQEEISINKKFIDTGSIEKIAVLENFYPSEDIEIFCPSGSHVLVRDEEKIIGIEY